MKFILQHGTASVGKNTLIKGDTYETEDLKEIELLIKSRSWLTVNEKVEVKKDTESEKTPKK